MVKIEILTIELTELDSTADVARLEHEGPFEHEEISRTLAKGLDLEPQELLAELTANPAILDRDKRHCRLKVTCVNVHFETESARHRFLARSDWAGVHRWGCRHFGVAKDACANLELHEGGPKGPVLNESKPIGHHKGCLNVWLVKPGPEPNGR